MSFDLSAFTPSPFFSGEFIHSFHPPSQPSILLVLLSRPPNNSFHTPFWKELHKIFDKIHRSSKVRVAILGSKWEKVFTMGLDVKASKDVLGEGSDPARRAYNIHQYILDFQASLTAISNCRQPVIACVSGICVGLGIDIITACDIRLCTEDLKAGVAEINVALAPDIGTLQRLPRTTSNLSLITELCLTGRTFTSTEALSIGLFSRVIKGGWKEGLVEGLRVARLIDGKSPIAVAGVKKLLNWSRDHSIQDGLEYTAAWNMSMLQSKDTADAMASFGTRRKVEFADMDNPGDENEDAEGKVKARL